MHTIITKNERNESTSDTRLVGIIAFAIFLLSVGLFAADLSSREPSNMESQDLEVARNLFTDLSLPIDQSPLYYVIYHFWQSFYDSSFAYLRFLSCLFAGLAAVIIFLLAKMEFGNSGGLIAALLFTTNPMVVEEARTARNYTLVLLLSLMCLYYSYIYLTNTRKPRHLTLFVVFAVLSIYTHLFMLLFVGSIGIFFIIDLAKNRTDLKHVSLILKKAFVGLLLVIPQLIRISSVFQYTEDRIGIYSAMPHGPVSFFLSIGREFYFGGVDAKAISSYFLIPILILLLIGLASQGRRSALLGLPLLIPSIGVAWILSVNNPMHPRYLIYLIPVTVLFISAALVRMRHVFIWGPLLILVTAVNVTAVKKEFDIPKSDWPEAARFIESIRQPGDVVTAFPDHWRWTLRRFYHDDELTSFTFVPDLDRIRMRGNRVIIVRVPDRPFNDVNAYLKKYAKVEQTFSTKVRKKISVHVLEPASLPRPELGPSDDPSILFTGIVGSGGYPWQKASPGENPFDSLSDVFKSADLTIASFLPYGPPLFKWVVSQPGVFGSLKPNERVLSSLVNAGVGALAMLPPLGHTTNALDLITAVGIQSIPLQPQWNQAEPQIFVVRGLKVGILHCGQSVFTDRPSFKDKGDAVLADVENAVRRAKKTVGPDGRLVVFLPQLDDTDRLFRWEDQEIAHRAIDLGATVVIGTGGYAVKELEEYKDGVIAYSLGTLLRPDTFGRVTLDSSGILLRIIFPQNEKPSYDIVPVTFDDLARPLIARNDAVKNVVWHGPGREDAENLMDRLVTARVNLLSKEGEKKEISEWVPGPTTPTSLIDRYFDRIIHFFESWLPRVPRPKTFHEGYTNGKVMVALDGVISQGIFRRAIVFSPSRNKTLTATFPKIFLGERLRISYGLDDKTIRDKTKSPKPQMLRLSIAGNWLFEKKVDYVTGWHSAIVDMADLAGTECDVVIALQASERSSFPVAVDVVIERDPDTLSALETQPYAFENHLREAKVVLEGKEGFDRFCTGPDETFRYLRGGKRKFEEHGPFAEGILFSRWVCSDLPWDSVARTIQKSGGELRPAIWLHPAVGAKRKLSFGPLELRSEIQGYFGLTDLAVTKTTADLTFVIMVGDRKLFSKKITNKAGWTSFQVKIPPDLQRQNQEIVFMATCGKPTWRHFCFNAWMQ